jgi:hypothetical protein
MKWEGWQFILSAFLYTGAFPVTPSLYISDADSPASGAGYHRVHFFK